MLIRRLEVRMPFPLTTRLAHCRFNFLQFSLILSYRSNEWRPCHLNKETSGHHNYSVTRMGVFYTLGTFQSLWQQLFCPNRPHFKAIYVKVSKSLIFSSDIIFGNFYKYLATFYWSRCRQLMLDPDCFCLRWRSISISDSSSTDFRISL